MILNNNANKHFKTLKRIDITKILRRIIFKHYY